MNVGHNFFSVDRVAETAIDPVRLGLVSVNIQAASLDVRGGRWPLRLGVFHPALRGGNDQRKDRAQSGKQSEEGRQEHDVSAPRRQNGLSIYRSHFRRISIPRTFHSKLRVDHAAHKQTHDSVIPKVTSA
jgi:hypothetical protein